MCDRLEKIDQLLTDEEEFTKYLKDIEEQNIEIPQNLNEKIINNIKVINNINESNNNSFETNTIKLTKSNRLSKK